MNKKGFTLVELLVTIAISTLVLSLGTILMNNVIDNSEAKTVTIAHENIKKGANLYSKEFFNEIVWLNNQSCISIEQLISKGYINKDKAKYAKFKYIIIKKDDNNTIVSELTENDFTTEDEKEKFKKICATIIHKTVSTITNKDICYEDLEYDGTSQVVHIPEPKDNEVYVWPKEDVIGTTVGDYGVEIGLNEGYKWNDGSIKNKTVYCTIKKGKPDLKVYTYDENGNEVDRSDGKKIETIEVIVESDVDGTIELKSSATKYATVELSPNNALSSYDLEQNGNKYTKKIIIKNNAVRKINTYITIKLNPSNPNYQPDSRIFTIGDITNVKVEKPTNKLCKKDLYFNNKEQTLTKTEEIGYKFYDNQWTSAGTHTVIASLYPGFEWEDGSKNNVTFDCEIKDLTYKVHYVGNGNTGQTYTDNSQCTDNKCGLNRYSSGSKYNSSKKIFEHTRDYVYGSIYNLVLNRFIKTGYSFIGWAKTENGSVEHIDKNEVTNLINPETDINGTIVNLYAKWAINTGKIYYYPNGGSAVEKWPLLTSEYGDGSYAGASSAIHTFDYNSTTLNPNNVTAIFSRTGYHIASDATAWRVGSPTSSTYLNQASQNMSSYVSNKTNVILKVYANWTPNTYTIKYDANGGTGTTASSTHTYDTAKKLTANGFTRTGYTFAGWTDSNGILYSNQQEVKNLTGTNGKTITLTARWTPKTYTITYEGNGGSSTTYGTTWSETATYDTNYRTWANWYTRPGYTFIGWNEKADGSGVSWTSWINKDWNWTYDKNVTLYAQWRVNKVYIQYSTNGGSITSSTTEDGIKYTWTTNSNGIIYRAKSGESATPNFYSYNYNGKIATTGLVNWNNSTYINITRTGYNAKSGAQWICLSGECKGTTYNHTTQYDASAFCNGSNGDCTVVLGVNWEVDNIAPTCTITKRTTNWDHNGVDITVNCSDSGSGCTKSSENFDNLKESKTYQVTDKAGNSGSCSVSIDTRKMWHKRTRKWNDCASTTTKWKGTCAIISPPNLKGTHSITGAASEEQCRDWCDDRTPGAFSIDCTSYSVCTGGYGSWGSWSEYEYTYNCSNGTTIECKYRTEYK